MRYFLPIFFFFIVNNLISQVDFEEGYIIDNQGNKKDCFIQKQDWSKQISFLFYKVSIDGSVQTLKPKDVSSFSNFENSFYSANVEVENSKRDIQKMSTTSEFDLEKKHVFLKELVSGKKSLFMTYAADGKSLYYVQHDNNFELLKYKRYIHKTPNGEVVRERRDFVNQLYTYLDDCEASHELLNTIEYNYKSLIKAYSNYYSCVNEKPTNIQDLDKTKYLFGLIGGGGIQQMNFKTSSIKGFQDIESKSYYGYSCGAVFQILVPRGSYKWSVVNELGIDKDKVEAFSNYAGYLNDEYSHNVDVNLLYLQLNNILRYTIKGRKNGLFFNLGISNYIAISSSNNSYTEHKFGETIIEGVLIGMEEIRKHQQALLVGTGFQLAHFGFEVRYILGNGISAYSNLKSTKHDLCFMVSYLF